MFVIVPKPWLQETQIITAPYARDAPISPDERAAYSTLWDVPLVVNLRTSVDKCYDMNDEDIFDDVAFGLISPCDREL